MHILYAGRMIPLSIDSGRGGGSCMWFKPLVLNDRTDHNDICMKIPCTDAEADVDVEEVSVGKTIGSVERVLSYQRSVDDPERSLNLLFYHQN
jgi:hypothetical protein